jgi:hypothetical protein
MRAIVNRDLKIAAKISGITELQHSEMTKQNEFNKEVIRRLKIQNKKLIEQVNTFRTRIKKDKTERTKSLSQIKDLLKLCLSLIQT